MTPTEERIAAIFGEHIGIEGVEADDDPYSIGADSELCIRIALEIEREFDVELPEDIIETHGTVRAIAGWVDNAIAGRAE